VLNKIIENSYEPIKTLEWKEEFARPLSILSHWFQKYIFLGLRQSSFLLFTSHTCHRQLDGNGEVQFAGAQCSQKACHQNLQLSQDIIARPFSKFRRSRWPSNNNMNNTNDVNAQEHWSFDYHLLLIQYTLHVMMCTLRPSLCYSSLEIEKWTQQKTSQLRTHPHKSNSNNPRSGGLS
jgi:hypothetical protein